MPRCLLLFLGVSTLISVASAQCSPSDHPSCASWAKNGFCTNPGYTLAYKQQYCPKTCTNSGCNTVNNGCPAGTIYDGPATTYGCPFATRVGSVCCYYLTPSNNGCPAGTIYEGPATNNVCVFGSRVSSVCCI